MSQCWIKNNVCFQSLWFSTATEATLWAIRGLIRVPEWLYVNHLSRWLRKRVKKVHCYMYSLSNYGLLLWRSQVIESKINEILPILWLPNLKVTVIEKRNGKHPLNIYLEWAMGEISEWRVTDKTKVNGSANKMAARFLVISCGNSSASWGP